MIYEFTQLAPRADPDAPALALARRLGLAPEDAVTGLSLARALLVLRDSKDDADASP